jgi:uncharacterized membrane protein YeaQ/YmgE (transglycosylase-associated protein family)
MLVRLAPQAEVTARNSLNFRLDDGTVGVEPSLPHHPGGSMAILWWIIVGLIAGWLTGKIMSGGGYGVLMDIVIGIVGAVIGGFIMRSLGFAGSGGMIYTILVAVLGAVLLTLLLRLITKGRP